MKYRIEAFAYIVGVLIVNTSPCCTVAAESNAADTQRHAAEESYRSGDLDKALRELEPLLDAEAAYEKPNERTHNLAAQILHTRGETHFRHALIAESIADFDRELLFRPDRRPQ